MLTQFCLPQIYFNWLRKKIKSLFVRRMVLFALSSCHCHCTRSLNDCLHLETHSFDNVLHLWCEVINLRIAFCCLAFPVSLNRNCLQKMKLTALHSILVWKNIFFYFIFFFGIKGSGRVYIYYHHIFLSEIKLYHQFNQLLSKGTLNIMWCQE